MKSNKLLSIQECHFNLPDDFNGTLGDALLLLAQHRLQSESDKKVNSENENCNCYTRLMNDNDVKCSIKYALCKLSDDKTKWETL